MFALHNLSDHFTITLKNVLFGVYFASAFVLVSILLYLDPSPTATAVPFPDFTDTLPWIMTVFPAQTLLYILALSAANRKSVKPILFITLGTAIALTIVASLVISRDYFIAVFPGVIAIYTTLIVQIRFFRGRFPWKELLKHLYFFSVMVCFFVFLWVVLMGYSLARGLTPRIVTIVPLDFYYLVLGLILFFTTIELRVQMYRTVYIHGDMIRIDNYDFSKYFSATNLAVVKLFITNANHTARCADISSALDNGNSEVNTEWDCHMCVNTNSKVTLCPKYRSIYNRINEIKRLFEAFEIGTIISPDNKLHILTEGWRLRLFDDVKLVSEPRGRGFDVSPAAILS